MQKITSITNQPKQKLSLSSTDGKIIHLEIYYVSSQIGWFMNVEYEGISTNCRRITNSPNLLRDKKNIYPFGIACSVEDGEEPWFLSDFKNGRATLYFMNKNDVRYVEEELYGEV